MTTTPDAARAAALVSDDRDLVFHSWSAQAARSAVPVAGAEGSWFWDHEGRRYLDGSSQLVNVNVGHQHPVLVEAVAEAARDLCTLGPAHAHESKVGAARKILDHTPGDLSKVFFTNAGADAVEHAVRMARHHTGRPKVLSRYRSYHGGTALAMTLTGEPRRWANDPGDPGSVHFFGPYPYRSHFGATTDEEECERALSHLSDVIALEGPHTIAAIILEPVTGTNGVLIPPDGYLAGVRELCDEHDIVMIADEVMVGFGRTGTWFAIDNWGVEPDLLTFAKGVNSGYVPLGGVAISPTIAASFDERPFPGGLTYSGHPLACAAAIACIGIYEDEGLIERSKMLGDTAIGPALRELAERHPSVGEVRGLGCFWALDLVKDPTTREMFVPFASSGDTAAPMAAVRAACLEHGLWPFIQFNRLHFAPPLTISEDEITHAMSALDAALAVADTHMV